jgi:hypothetical protein
VVRLARKLAVNVGGAALALWVLTSTSTLMASDAFLVGLLAAVVGTLVMEYG